MKHSSIRFGAPLAALALLVFSTAGPATAAPAPSAGALTATAADAASRGQSKDVTLITGDVVHVTVASNGTYQTQTDIAPRPDGRHVLVQTLVDAHHVYVVPSDAGALIASGAVDRRLFDVRQLIAEGDTSTLPVILSYPAGALRPAAVPAVRTGRALASLHGSAAMVASKDAATFWSTVDPTPATTALGAGLSHVWLDGKARAALDTSVPLIGAPEAWAAGLDGSGVTVAILDTGVDSTHPDLAGRVVASQSFVPGVSDVRDGNGHGTHVASTIAGSGAASGGRYRGVAPGAGLAIGKVLDDSGNGADSDIIAGMEWAAQTAHARIVSMSLGSLDASDGTDPMSEAIDALTASTGTLFVVAAGNAGPGARTVSAPGAADAALTVAAVDKSDHLADFSSRGPRLTDYALKPDIAAPGVDITAARAAGTSLGNPVNQYYTTLSGTSMATPHVAGSAAILVEEHPQWTAPQLKAALMGTAKDDGYTAYQQGAGRVDIGTAFQAKVLTETDAVDFGRVRYPYPTDPQTRQVTYRNDGTQPVTVTLSASLGSDSGTAPAGMLAVSPGTLVVPAGGSAAATVTLSAAAAAAGIYSGAVTATAAGISLRTPIGAYLEAEGFELTVHVTPPATATNSVVGDLVIRRVDTDTGEWVILPGTLATTVHLDKGVYQVGEVMAWADSPGDLNNEAILANPQVDLSQDATVTLDAGQARPIDVVTDRPTETYGVTLGLWRTPAGASTPYGVVTGQLPYGVKPMALPTRKVTIGGLFFEHTHLLGTPLVTASAANIDLQARYQHYSAKVPKLTGKQNLPLVDAGSGSADDFAKVDVRGKVALIDIGDQGLGNYVGGSFAGTELQNAFKAGAVAVIAYPNSGRPAMNTGNVALHSDFPVPTMGIPSDEGAALHARLGHGSAMLRVDSEPTIPDVYTLSYLDSGAVPAQPRYRATDRDLATVKSSLHGDRPVALTETWGPRRPGILNIDGYSASFSQVSLTDLPGPFVHTEHIGPVSPDLLWNRSVDSYDLDQFLAVDLGHQIQQYLGSTFTGDVFDRPISRTETWGESPTVPGAAILPPAAAVKLGTDGLECATCRYAGILPGGDIFPLFTSTVDGAGHVGEQTTYANGSLNPDRTGVDEWHLYANGTELTQQRLAVWPYYVLPASTASYRLTEHFSDWEPMGGFGTKADTTWQFSSGPVSGKQVPNGYDALGLCQTGCQVEPLVFLRYQLNLRPDNRATAGKHTIQVTPYRQPSLVPLPRIAGLTVSASFDGGQHWIRVPASANRDGGYDVTLNEPATGTVSLRTEAWDAAGNRIDQTVYDAYGLTH